MAKPTPKTVDPSEVAELARATMTDAERLACKIVPNRVSYIQEWALEYHDVPLQLG